MEPLTRPPLVPSAAVGPAFRFAEARAAGYSEHGCGPPRMVSPTKSIRTLEPLTGLREWAGAFTLALPDDVVLSHVTAARLWGLPLPRSIRAESGMHVMRATGRPPIERLWCVSHRGLERRRVEHHDGLPVTSLPDTWLDVLAAYHSVLTLDDVVMLGDAVVERLRPTRFVDDLHPSADPATPDWWRDPVTAGCGQLRAALLSRPRFRGKRLAQEALRLIRPRVWSAMESYSRTTVVEAELPEPELNKSVFTDCGAEHIGIVDLHWKRDEYRHRVAGEYQGKADHTEEEDSRDRDNVRRLRLEDEGWKVLEIYAGDVFNARRRGQLIGRLARWLGLS